MPFSLSGWGGIEGIKFFMPHTTAPTSPDEFFGIGLISVMSLAIGLLVGSSILTIFTCSLSKKRNSLNRKKVISIPALDFTIILAMIRAFAGPTAADRLVGIKFIAGQVILFTLVSSPRHDIALYIDVALVFVLGAL